MLGPALLRSEAFWHERFPGGVCGGERRLQRQLMLIGVLA
jgi:hypothetical protein